MFGSVWSNQTVAVNKISSMIQDKVTGLTVLHPPKTGGTSVRRALESDNRARYLDHYNHLTAHEAGITGPTLITVRDPLSRWVSNYHHMINWAQKNHQPWPEALLKDRGLTGFSEILVDPQKREWFRGELIDNSHHYDAMLKTQASFILSDTEVFKCEDGGVWHRLNTREMKTKVRKYSYPIDPQVREWVEQYYSDDFGTFSY
jgi:hypothetical protein